MASLPSPEESARQILAIFVEHFKCRADHVLRAGNFIGVWHSRGLVSEDFEPGMQYAAEQGWVEIQSGGQSFKLTELGFGEA